MEKWILKRQIKYSKALLPRLGQGTVHLLSATVLGILLLALTACGGQEEGREPGTSTPKPTPTETVSPDDGDKETSPGSSVPDGNGVEMDMSLVPGEQVGPVTSTTNREELGDLFGEATLKDTDIPIGEGFTEPGTVVDLGPEKSFAIIWTDETRSQPLLAKDFGPAWKTSEGLGVGTSFADLKTILGDFQLYGFAWDYEGSLVLEGSNLDKYYGDLLLRVRPDKAAIDAHQTAYQAVTGDSLFSADDPNVEVLEPSVYEMTIYLNSLSEE